MEAVHSKWYVNWIERGCAIGEQRYFSIEVENVHEKEIDIYR